MIIDLNNFYKGVIIPALSFSLIIFIILCYAFSSSVHAQENDKKDDNSENIALMIDQYLSASGISGGILIAKEGKILLNEGYGWANEKEKIAISSRTVFDIGSVTKQFTAAAILKLEEQGKLKTSDTITNFFNAVPEDKQNITIHQLLTHTAGFEHDAIEITEFPSRSEAIKITLNSELKFNPGEKFSYSNAGYGLLAAIIELTSGMGYETFLYHYLWQPVGMLDTGNLIPQWQQKQIVRPYDLYGEVQRPINQLWAEDGPSWSTRGSGAVLSTLKDLYTWHKTLQGDKVLSRESRQKLFKPHVPMGPSGDYYYGYGWSISRTDRGTTLVQHNGGNSYNFTDFYRYVDEDVVIIYFTNERRTISLKILDSVPSLFYGKPFPQFPQPAVNQEELDLNIYSGLYQLSSGEIFKLYINNGIISVDIINKEIGKLLTSFPTPDNYRINDQLQIKISNIAESVARGNMEKIRDLIYWEGTFGEEKDYWHQKFSEWSMRFGPFTGSEIIGNTLETNLSIWYVMFHFNEGSTLVQFREHEKKKFFIGTSTALLPRFYRFVPQSKNKFLVYNPIIKTVTQIHFNFTTDGNKVRALNVQRKNGNISAKKIE